jgi:glycosyltransferase involved in cell wall biosynthesis
VRRLLMVGRTRYRLPLTLSLQRKFDALAGRFDVRVLATGVGRDSTGDATFDLERPVRPASLGGLWFYGRLPFRIAAELRRTPTDVIAAQSPYEGLAALLGRWLARDAGGRPPVIVEIHGDWRTFARLYGSSLRRVVAPVADRLARLAVRRADAVRTLSPFTTELVRSQGVEPAAVFTTYTELTAFSEPPVSAPGERPVALVVGVLEPYKNIDGIAAAWRLAAPRVPSALLRIVGDGRRRDITEALLRDLPAQTEWIRRLETPEVVEALDGAWLLLLPSRSEGTPRVVMEALCRARAVVGGRAGGIPDVVEHEVTGLLVDPERPHEIADALVRLLGDRALCEKLGAAGHERAGRWTYTPTEYATRMAELVERVVAS